MQRILFQYRSRELNADDLSFIQSIIAKYYCKGRTYISQVLCREWQWFQPNGKLKEFAARDLLLRLEENKLIKLPPRINKNNNLKRKCFRETPSFIQKELCGSIGNYNKPAIKLASKADSYLWNYLVEKYHYLGTPTLVGKHLKYLCFINDQIVACLAWASPVWKIKFRDQFIGWDEPAKRKNLHLIANNTRFLILPWIRIKFLASKLLALSIRCLQNDWLNTYGHPIYLLETFVDNSRFNGTCYQASNWIYVGQTKGNAKRGNAYHYHGQSKAIYLYPTDRRFRRFLNHDQG